MLKVGCAMSQALAALVKFLNLSNANTYLNCVIVIIAYFYKNMNLIRKIYSIISTSNLTLSSGHSLLSVSKFEILSTTSIPLITFPKAV